MINLIRREFIVEAPLAAAWQHLAQVEKWPSWARHIKHIKLVPVGELMPQSQGMIYLRNGVRADFRMTEFNLHRNWKWAGPFLWLTVHYDHRFEAVDRRRTRMAFVVDAEGFGVETVGKIFAALYKRNLDRAIPRLVAEMKDKASSTDH